MGRVRRTSTTGSVMIANHGAGRRLRNPNQLDLFGSLLLDPAQTVAPIDGEPEQVGSQHGREEPLEGYDSETLAGAPPANGRGPAQELSTGAGNLRGGSTDRGPSSRTSSVAENAVPGRLGDGDTGVGVPADRGPPLTRVLFDLNPVIEEKPSRDFRLTESHRIGQGGLHEKARDNLAAIRTLKLLEAENRDATDPEKAILAGYAGWGSLPNAFAHYPPEEWRAIAQEVKDLLTPEEYESDLIADMALTAIHQVNQR